MKQVTYTEPYIQFIEQILDSMKRGHLLCPQFQRTFVWEIKNQISLLESVKNGLPIGSIMVWKTTNLEIDYYEKISGFTFFDKQEIDPSKNSSKSYILDGLQRLTTLYVALNRKNTQEEDVENQTSFYYHLKKKIFLSNSQIKKENTSMLMPLNILLDNIALLKFQRNLFKIISNEQEVDELVNEIDAISAAFRQYKIPIIPVVTDDISVATNSFQRINSEGVKVNDLEMIHALTWKEKYDFNSEIERLKVEELDSFGWGEIPIDIIIKTIKLMLNKNIYKTDAIDLSKSILENKEIISVAVKYIRYTISYIGSNFKIPSFVFIPYSLQIVILAYIFKFSNDNSIQHNSEFHELIEDWFWFTSYTQAFSGMSDNDFKKCITDFEIMLNLGGSYWSNKKVVCEEFSINKKYNFRSVKTKLSVLNLARLQYEFFISNNLDNLYNPYESLNKFGTDAIMNIFSDRELLIDPFDNDKIHKSLSNKIILPPDYDLSYFKYINFYEEIEHKFLDGFDKGPILFNDKAYGINYSLQDIFDDHRFFYQRLSYLHETELKFFSSKALKFINHNLCDN